MLYHFDTVFRRDSRKSGRETILDFAPMNQMNGMKRLWLAKANREKATHPVAVL